MPDARTRSATRKVPAEAPDCLRREEKCCRIEMFSFGLTGDANVWPMVEVAPSAFQPTITPGSQHDVRRPPGRGGNSGPCGHGGAPQDCRIECRRGRRG